MNTVSAMSARASGLSLPANFGWTFAGNVVYAASLWGLLTVLVKLGNPGMVGQFALGLAVAAPVLAISMLQLRAVQVTDAREEFRFEHYFGARLVTSSVALLVIAGIAWCGVFDAQTAWIITIVGLAKCIDSVSEIVRGLFQRHERMHLSGGSLMIKGPAALVTFGLMLWLTKDLAASAVGMAVAWMLVLALYDLPQAQTLLRGLPVGAAPHRLVPRFDRHVLMSLAWRALPLGVVALLGAFQNSLPRYVLQAGHGNAPLGYFAALAYPMVAGTMVISALGQSASPRLATYFVGNIGQYVVLLKKLLLLALGLGLLFVLGVFTLGKVALTLLYAPDYAQYQTEFLILSLAAAIAFATSFCGYGLTAARAFGIQSALAGATCATAVGATFWLVPSYGIRGAAIAVAVTAGVMFVGFAIALGWVVNKRRRGLAADAQGPAGTSP